MSDQSYKQTLPVDSGSATTVSCASSASGASGSPTCASTRGWRAGGREGVPADEIAVRDGTAVHPNPPATARASSGA